MSTPVKIVLTCLIGPIVIWILKSVIDLLCAYPVEFAAVAASIIAGMGVYAYLDYKFK